MKESPSHIAKNIDGTESKIRKISTPVVLHTNDLVPTKEQAVENKKTYGENERLALRTFLRINVIYVSLVCLCSSL